MTVHPHACGEYYRRIAAAVCCTGSPPRLWGIHPHIVELVKHWRFTPTPVGNTFTTLGWQPTCTVHPHACGEYVLAVEGTVTARGSPPRLWGILQEAAQFVLGERFTPTPVGNTAARWRPAEANAVHPHACGEYASATPMYLNPTGSPPRLWGILQSIQLRRRLPRFTPTPVGNTTCAQSLPSWMKVHPHACGEYPLPCLLVAGQPGSPPRLWGIPGWIPPRWTYERFTPTPVGNT